MARTLTVTDSVLVAMARRQDLVAEFPFLKRAAMTKNRKRGCNCKRPKASGQLLTSLKMALANLDPKKAERLKAILGVSKIAVFIKSPTGTGIDKKVL